MPKVLISGCFTFLHIGHKFIIQEAAKLGDLYVALNSDEYIIRTKGPEKLILNWADRARSLFDTKLVKDVIFFDDDTPQKVALDLKPDYVVVGSDHNDNDMVWAKVIEEWGGRIIYIQRLKDENGVDISTTNILNSLVEVNFKKAVETCINGMADKYWETLLKNRNI